MSSPTDNTPPSRPERPLTEKQMAFVLGVFQGKSATQAYLEAYAAKNENVAAVEGSKLLTKPKIQLQLEKLRAEVIERVIEETAVDKAWVMKRLVQNVERSMQLEAVTEKDGKVVQYKYAGSVANKALELIGTELGMFKITVKDIPWDELEPEDLKMIEKGILPFKLRKMVA